MNTLRLFALSATLFAAFVTSCAPKDAPVYRFKIKVVAINEDGEAIALQNATVRATAPVVNAIPDFEGRSGVDGIVRDADGNDIFSTACLQYFKLPPKKAATPPWCSGAATSSWFQIVRQLLKSSSSPTLRVSVAADL